MQVHRIILPNRKCILHIVIYISTANRGFQGPTKGTFEKSVSSKYVTDAEDGFI